MAVEREAKDSELESLIVRFGDAEFNCGQFSGDSENDCKEYKKLLITRNSAKSNLIRYLESKK